MAKSSNCPGAIDLSTMNLPSTASLDMCAVIEACPSIGNLKAKDSQLQTQIDNLRNGEIANLAKKISDAIESATEGKAKDEETQQLLRELNDNIAMLKGWNVRQEAAIKSLLMRVILDDQYLNFEEWVENVYIPQCDALENKYSMGHLYLNINRDIAASQGVYVNIRSPKSTAPCSANDWQLLPGTKRNELLTLIGIDPIVVSRIDKHTWSWSLDPVKFQDFMAELKTLDLSKVDVSLGEVYFEPIFKEDATIEEDLNVGATTTTKDLVVTGGATIEQATIKKACIEEFTCDTTFNENVTVKETLTATSLEATGTSTFHNTKLTGSTTIERVDGEVYLSDHVIIGDGVEVTGTSSFKNKTTMHDLRVEEHLHIPQAAHVIIGGKHFEDWLVSFGNQHWQRR